MQAGIGVSKILILAGAGYTGTIFLKNGKLSDLFAELHLLLKGLENLGDQSNGESENADVIASQMGRLAYEIRQLALNRPILNGSSAQNGNMLSLVTPVAALSALGYGYIWWKGLSLSSLMYVTKRSMEKAVSDLTKKLLHASDVIAHAKKHLTQRIQHLDDKMLKQNELARSIKDEVTGVRNTITDFHKDLVTLKQAMGTLDAKLSSLSWKQDYANHGLDYLIDFVHGKSGQMPEFLQKQVKLPGKSPSLLTYGGSPSLKGLKDIAGTLSTGLEQSASDGIMQNCIDKLEQHRRPMLRLLQSGVDDKVFSR
ncbi:uncharacterized protein LOC129311953 isoform X2 [Prosopis cineraria]|uniref:uncharacterized protein LOC129311953 isoform X2 n=1 Tax=Prosopis cineraria TaxID=364024 RepID=UPI00240F1914|nr:uncharacterized protein LOC129311953 isoform X2 [Prosopis cineraria]